MSFAARDAFSAAATRPPGFAPVTHLYLTPGTYTETTPPGATSLQLQIGGPGGGGGSNAGGGSGGWCEVLITLGSVGLSFTVVVAAGGAVGLASSASSVVGAGFNQIAGAGAAGGLSGGAGGVASGGGVLVSGNQGSPTAGGQPVVGIISSGAGGAPGAAGQAGAAAFAYR